MYVHVRLADAERHLSFTASFGSNTAQRIQRFDKYQSTIHNNFLSLFIENGFRCNFCRHFFFNCCHKQSANCRQHPATSQTNGICEKKIINRRKRTARSSETFSSVDQNLRGRKSVECSNRFLLSSPTSLGCELLLFASAAAASAVRSHSHQLMWRLYGPSARINVTLQTKVFWRRTTNVALATDGRTFLHWTRPQTRKLLPDCDSSHVNYAGSGNDPQHPRCEQPTKRLPSEDAECPMLLQEFTSARTADRIWST